MNKKEYWQAHVARNPKFKDEEATLQLKVGMLRRLMEEAFDKGSEHARRSNKFIEDIFQRASL